jgi:hypothetical protein
VTEISAVAPAIPTPANPMRIFRVVRGLLADTKLRLLFNIDGHLGNGYRTKIPLLKFKAPAWGLKILEYLGMVLRMKPLEAMNMARDLFNELAAVSRPR